MKFTHSNILETMIKTFIGLGIVSATISSQISEQLLVTKPNPVKTSTVKYKSTWKCPKCTPEEQYVLKKLQESTKITDRNALATILGNIKQESKFVPNICEGGARVSYNECRVGGYGLIQWTSIGRYKGLGRFCNKYACDPSSLEGQTRYMINEPIFQKYLPSFEGSGQTVQQYMIPAYYWLGWGIKGKREYYSYNYSKKLIWA